MLSLLLRLGEADYKQLASAFIARHFIEYSTYVFGGNFTGFKSLPGKSLDIRYLIVEIEVDGDFLVTI